MYIAGTQQDFQNRLHALCENEADYDAYKAERDTYSSAPQYLQNYWDKELIKKEIILNLYGI